MMIFQQQYLQRLYTMRMQQEQQQQQQQQVGEYPSSPAVYPHFALCIPPPPPPPPPFDCWNTFSASLPTTIPVFLLLQS